MSSDRPLPSVIGPTENSLRALLSRTLSSTAIANYPAWVVINAASSANSGSPDDRWKDPAADALKRELVEIDRIVRELQAGGLLDDRGALTVTGTTELAGARRAVREVTLRLIEGIDESQQQTARAVLDLIRVRTDALLVA